MKSAIVVVVLMSTLLPADADARGGGIPAQFRNLPVMKGDEAVVPSNFEYWWSIHNLKPIRNGSKEFRYGDQCQAVGGGKFTVIGLDGDYRLVRFTVAGVQSGTMCPDKTIMYIRSDDFNTVRFRNHLEAEKKKVTDRRKAFIATHMKD